MNRWIGIGSLAGIVFGIILDFIFPQAFIQEVYINMLFRKASGYDPVAYYPGSGSIFAAGMLFPAIFAIVGFFLGGILFKVKEKFKSHPRK